MILRYVWKGFRRHKGRTAIMVVALAFVAAMLVVLNNTIATSRRQVVDLVARQVGEHDITVARADTSPDPFIEVERVSNILRAADPNVRAVYPRFRAVVELTSGATQGSATLIARDPQADTLGEITVLEGEYRLDDEHVVLLRNTADAYGLHVGDEVYLSYELPVPRRKGEKQPENISVSRVSRRFTVGGIALQDGLGSEIHNGILANVYAVQGWLGMPGRAGQLVVVLDERVYNTLNVERSIFRVRRIAERMRAALGREANEYEFTLEKAQALDDSDIAFSMMQTLTLVYGLLSMGVVGLLVYSLINANVDDRRRDLAFMRIIGAQRIHLFALVLIEVGIVGAIGIAVGLVAGQAVSTLVVDRMLDSLLANMMENQGGLGGVPTMGEIELAISPWSLFSTVAIAGLVLLVSALAPARKAANTKIRYAINPGAADNIQIEDLAALRVRRYNWRITIAGFVLTVMWGLIFVGQNYLFARGSETVMGAFMFGGMALLILGVSLLFFTLTIPFERLVLLAAGLVVPRLTFFAARNVRRAKRRSTVIALMIVFSATLPTFLGTTTALTEANFDVMTRQLNGAPINAQMSRRGGYYVYFFENRDDYLHPAFLSRFALPGVEPVVGLTYSYMSKAHNLVQLREATLNVLGVTSSLLGVVYPDLTSMVGDGDRSFRRLLAEPDAIIVTAGLARYLDLGFDDTIVLDGNGLDHKVEMHVVGLIERMPGFWDIGRGERYVRWGSSAFVSLDTFLRLVNDPNREAICVDGRCSEPERDRPVIRRVMAGLKPTADPQQVVKSLRNALADRNDIRIEVTAEQVRMARQGFVATRVILLILTTLSLITSVLGVFSVIYVTVQTRRLEIGMLKAIGITGRQLVGTFAIESLSMTVSATLTGTTAGTCLGYVFYTSNNTMQNVPTIPAFDAVTVTFVLVMVIVSSLISAAVASRGIVRRRVTAILRGV